VGDLGRLERVSAARRQPAPYSNSARLDISNSLTRFLTTIIIFRRKELTPKYLV
jgi:hypothetical protein